MEDEILNNGEEFAETPTPKKRGRKPKMVQDATQSTENGETSKRRGRPRKSKDENAETSSVPASESPVETSQMPLDIIEAAKMEKKRGKKRGNRNDGPVWRESKPLDENPYDASRTEIFEHKDQHDDFEYAEESTNRDNEAESEAEADEHDYNDNRDNRNNSQNRDNDDDIPQSFSTSDEDLIQDNYGDNDEESRQEENSPNPRSNEDYEASPTQESPTDATPQNGSQEERQERNYNRQDRWQNNRNQNREQNRDGQNNRDSRNQYRDRQDRQDRQDRWQNNRNQNRDGQNNRQDRWQNNRNQNANQQNQRNQNNNRNQQNQRNQNANQLNQRNQNNNNRNQNNNQQNQRNQLNQQRNQLKKKPRWMQNQGAEEDLMNPAELPEWEALKSQAALDQFLKSEFFGTPIETTIAAETSPDNAQKVAEAAESEKAENLDQENAQQVASTEEDNHQQEESPAQETSPEENRTETAEAPIEKIEMPAEKDPEEELAEMRRNKSVSDMSYWELMVNANDTSVEHSQPQPEPQKEEEAPQVAIPSKEEQKQTENTIAATATPVPYQEPKSLQIDGAGTLEVIEDFNDIYNLELKEIQNIFNERNIPYRRGTGKSEMMADYYKYANQNKKLVKVSGVLDVFEDGFGGAISFACDSYKLRRMSVYVPQMFIEKYGLKRGHEVSALTIAPRENFRGNCPIAVKIVSAMNGNPDDIRNYTPFTDLTPYYPTRRIIMEATDAGWDNLSMRAVDLLTPIGFGQRALIVAPPRTGKTVLMQGMAKSIRLNAPEAHLMILLVDERPEEVTDFKRSVDAEVIASTFDEDAFSHVHAAEMVISRARRMVEDGKDVVILLDSITRLARAYNALMPNGGRTMSGGVEATALQKPKKFFGSARNIEGGGSLTIIGTALIETGSKMDEVIFEEFKGTGNLELHLDRALSDKRIFPSINMEKSGTRKEELLYHPDEMIKIYALRRAMKGVPATDAMEMLVQRLKKVKTNVEFLIGLNR